MFAADVVMAMTGIDPAEPLRGKYDTASGALRATREFAGGSLRDAIEAIAASHGGREIPAALAQRGDFALVSVGGREALGIVIDWRVAAAAPVGLSFVPVSDALKVWAV